MCGARVQSFLLATFEMSFLDYLGTLSMCVVDRDCPPLFSRLGRTAVGGLETVGAKPFMSIVFV